MGGDEKCLWDVDSILVAENVISATKKGLAVLELIFKWSIPFAVYQSHIQHSPASFRSDQSCIIISRITFKSRYSSRKKIRLILCSFQLYSVISIYWSIFKAIHHFFVIYNTSTLFLGHILRQKVLDDKRHSLFSSNFVELFFEKRLVFSKFFSAYKTYWNVVKTKLFRFWKLTIINWCSAKYLQTKVYCG